MQKVIIMCVAAMLGVSQAAYAESQNPHDPVNQPNSINTDIHINDNVNADSANGSTGSAVPNPNSLGRTGRLRDPNNLQRNQGVQMVPSNPDNISDRIENANDANRRLHDRLDGRDSPTVDPAFNSDGNPATPVLPPGQGPGVTSATGTNGTASDNTATSKSDQVTGASAQPGSRAVSGSGSASGSAANGGSSGASSSSSSSSGGGGR